MKNLILLFSLTILPIIIFSQDTKKVLIIGIDGVRPDALQVANTPNLDQLISNGIFAPDALNDDITVSGPGWSAILCGVWSDKHLVTGNNFSGNNYTDYSSIFKYVEDFDSDLHTVSICHWAPINDNIVQDFADYKLNTSTDSEVSTQAASYLNVNDPDLVFLHFDEPDYAGHSFGFSPEVPEYISAIEGVDVLIGPIIQAIETRPTYENEDWLILVTTDHGGLGTSHGGTTIEEENVFIIVSGKNIPTQIIEKDSALIFDNPTNCLGDSTELQFDGVNDFVQIPDNSIFDFGADQDFTIECRVRTNQSADVAIVGNKDWNSGNNQGFVFSYKYPSGPEWKVNIGDGNNRADIDIGGQIADNEWHTLSVTFDRDGEMKMYEDGIFLAAENISNVGDISTGQGLFFGTDVNQSYNYMGSIAEVRVWNTVLEEATINTWHCDSLENTHPNFSNLIGYWKMNEGEGNTQVQDFSINENHGNITDAIWDSSDSIVVYDYENTSRLVDIPVTAMTHLCLPINAGWNLDGISLIDECEGSNTENIFLKKNIQILISPNPSADFLKIEISNWNSLEEIELEINTLLGEKAKEFIFHNNAFTIDISDLKHGSYFLNFKLGNKIILKKFIKI